MSSRPLVVVIASAWLWGAAALPILAPVIVPAQVSAQAEDADGVDDVADDRAQSFQAVSGAVQEDVPGGPLMLAAYAAVWIVVFGYVFRINRLQRGVEANLERLERSIAGQGTSPS